MESVLNMNNLEFGCKLINETINIPIFVLNQNGDLVQSFSTNDGFNPLYSSKQEFFNQTCHYDTNDFIPIIHTTDCHEQMVFIPIKNNNLFFGTIILGPTIFPRPTKASLDEIVHTHGIKDSKEEVTDYFHSLPVMSSSKLIHSSILLFYILYHQKLDIQEVTKQNNITDNIFLDELMSNKNIANLRQNASFHHDPISEKKIYQYIIDGKKEELLLYWKSFKENANFEFGKLSKKNEVRNQKNLSIATITLATRAAITGGLHPETAYTLGDTYIQELEELYLLEDIHFFIEEVICEFAERVDKSKKHSYSKPISHCLDYIYKHIYEDLSLPALANYVSMSPKYLSNLFKKEVGISISEYIQQTKIEEAKKLMTFSEYSISEIHTLLNFTDQSYFTKVFKKHTELTPKQFMKIRVPFQ